MKPLTINELCIVESLRSTRSVPGKLVSKSECVLCDSTGINMDLKIRFLGSSLPCTQSTPLEFCRRH
jgi:hypothetical protein